MNKLKTYLQNKNQRIVSLLVVLVVTLVLSTPYLVLILASHIAPGMDGEMLLSLIDTYSKNTFPKPFGYYPGINTGHAWPLFYGPSFTYVVSACSNLTGLNTLLVTKAILILCTLLPPFLIYLIADELKPSKQKYVLSPALVSALLTVLFLTSVNSSSCYGPGACGGIIYGMYGQYLGQLFFYVALLMITKINYHPWLGVIRVLMISLTLASGFFQIKLMALTVFLFTIHLVLTKRVTMAIRLCIEAGLAVGMLSFWFLPGILNARFQDGLTDMLTSRLVKTSLIYKLVTTSSGLLSLLFLSTAVTIYLYRDGRLPKPTVILKNFHGLLYTAICVIFLLYLTGYVPPLDNRTINTIFPLVFIPAGFAISKIASHATKKVKTLVVVACLCIFAPPLDTYKRETFSHWGIFNKTGFEEKVEHIVKVVKPGERLYLVPFANPINYLNHQKYIGYLARKYDVSTLWCMFSGTNQNLMAKTFLIADKKPLDEHALRIILNRLAVTKIVTDTRLTDANGFRLADSVEDIYIYDVLNTKPLVECKNCGIYSPITALKDNTISVENLSNDGTEKTAIISYTYFPFLKDEYGGNLTPTQEGFIELRTNNPQARIVYAEGNEFNTGRIISLVFLISSLIYTVVMSIRNRNFRGKINLLVDC